MPPRRARGDAATWDRDAPVARSIIADDPRPSRGAAAARWGTRARGRVDASLDLQVWLTDKHALPLQEGETHVSHLWYMNGDREISAMLEGACDGEDRKKLWDELKSVHAAAAAVDEEAAAAAPAPAAEAST